MASKSKPNSTPQRKKKTVLPNRVKKDQVEKAVRALVTHIKSHVQKKEKTQLFESEDTISVILGLRRIPEKRSSKPFPINLAHGMHDSGDVCLFVKDPQQEFKSRLEDHPDIPISKVIGVTKLKKNYKSFEVAEQSVW